MTFLIPSILAMALSSPPDCSLRATLPGERRVYTNADLDRMAACRYQTGVHSEIRIGPPENASRTARPAAKAVAAGASRPDALEEDWRAQWRSIDQKARRLRREARELRQEAGESRRDPKKPVTGRRSPSLLLARARALETEAKELQDEFEERARREGALPGWLRPKGR